jgi:hypothetical protein
MTRILIAAGAVVAAAVVFVVLRPEEDGDSASSGVETTMTATTTETRTAPTTTVAPPPPQPPPPARVRIVVREGQPVGGVRRVTVSEGRRVVLIVTSDVSDHVHLHGYNIMRDVAPGQPARIAFRATIVGTVEAELEDRRVPLARIVTQP